MAAPCLPAIRFRDGTVEFPVHHMRGGTSTGLVLWERLVPRDLELCEALLRLLMGVPASGRAPGNRQITGLGRGAATSNKVFFADTETVDGQPRLVSTLAQLAAEHADIDWGVNCGNMSAALQLWAQDVDLLTDDTIEIRNTNTGVLTRSRMTRAPDDGFALAAIPGVPGRYPGVDLFLQRPVGARTGRLLPTGQPMDRIAGRHVSCVDVAVPMLIARAADFGITGDESPQTLGADAALMRALRETWVEGGLRMGLRHRDGRLMDAAALARSETVPKICLVSPPRAGGHVSVRYFTPQSAHATMAVSGGCCLAAAVLTPGTVAHAVSIGAPVLGPDVAAHRVDIENPAGILEATVVARASAGSIDIDSVAYRRSAQILLRGHVPLYGASDALVASLLALRSDACVAASCSMGTPSRGQ